MSQAQTLYNVLCSVNQQGLPKSIFARGTHFCFGRIQTGSYTNKDGVKVYTTVVIVEEQEFAESKSESKNTSNPVEESSADDGFMNLTDEYDDKLPFHCNCLYRNSVQMKGVLNDFL